MKIILNSFKLISAILLVALFTGCSTTKRTENMLTLAGFKVVAVSTPKQEQKLKALPPGKVTLAHRSGKTYYVFPDTTHHQLYVGTKKEYEGYRQILLDNQISGQDRIDDEMEPADGNDWDGWSDWVVLGWN